MDEKIIDLVVVEWIAESLRPFSMVESNGLNELVSRLCSLNREYKLDSQNTARTQMDDLNKKLKTEMIELMKNEMDFLP